MNKFLFLAVWLIANSHLYAQQNSARTTKMEKTNTKIESLFKQIKALCFGRFVIDVPATAVVAWGPATVDDSIVSYPGQGNKIPAQISAKIEELKAEKHLKELSTLIGIVDGPNPNSKVVVGYSSFEDTGLVQLHSYIRIGRHAFVQTAKSAPLADLASGGIDKLSYKRYVTRMLNVANRLQIRDEAEMPSEPGICIEAGFVSVDDGRFHESTSIGFRFPEYPDISFSIRTIKTDRPDKNDSLEASLTGGQESLLAAGLGKWFSGTRTLRQEARRVGDWDGSEVLFRMPPEERGMPSTHEFKFKSIGVANDIFRPYVDMELSSGVDKNTKGVYEPSLKDDEAVALWDKLTSSVRARPTGK